MALGGVPGGSESKVAGQHAGDHHGKGTDSDSLAHTGQDRDKGGHDHGVGSQFSENSGDNTNQNYNQDGVHARQAGEHIGDPLRATGIPKALPMTMEPPSRITAFQGMSLKPVFQSQTYSPFL